MAIASWLLACVVPFCAVAALAADDGLQKVPPLTARVTDLTGTLDAGQSAAIDSDLAALEQRKGAQLGVLLVPTTAPEDIAQFGIRVADAWKLGRKGTDDGAILIVAKNDRRVRIEVGRGLEGAIPDATADRIIREYIAPKFRANDYAGGIRDATGALIKLVDGEPLPPPLSPERAPRKSTDGFNSLVVALFAIVWARAFFGRVPVAPRGGLVGLVGGGAGWLLTGGLLSAALGFGVLGLILGLLGGAGGGFANRGGWSAFPGGFGGLGGGGGFGGGGGGGGGGFSGGGGGFAGGGASGSW